MAKANFWTLQDNFGMHTTAQSQSATCFTLVICKLLMGIKEMPSSLFRRIPPALSKKTYLVLISET